MLLCTYVGVGTQLICMAVVTMIFAVLGFLSPANRGGFMTAVLLLFVFMGVFAGYSAARLYKSFKVTSVPQLCGDFYSASKDQHIVLCQCPYSCMEASKRGPDCLLHSMY